MQDVTRETVQAQVRRRVQGRRRAGRTIKTAQRPSPTSWDDGSTYVQNPPFFDGIDQDAAPVTDIAGRARPGPARRQDHHRPHLAGRQHQARPPGGQLPAEHGCEPADFNQYGARRGNHEVMMRGTFANIRIKNAHGDAAATSGRRLDKSPCRRASRCSSTTRPMRYKAEGVPLIVFAGKEYGTGSSRDWAAKGTLLLGVRAVDRRELRAHPPQQPGRHGRPAASSTTGRHELAVAGPER